uniref:Immunoglobulin domain-containing protein n=1 Tax=Sinocyclocheilus grahami TaxID=75366 RepID=A0A672M2G9_SINGR
MLCVFPPKKISFSQLLVCVSGVSAAERNETKAAKEGESVTLHPGKIKKTNDCMMWYFKDILIAEITGDPNVQCEKRFRDRLKLDHQTGSLTIINIKTTDSELYELQFNNGIIEKIYYVSVHDGVSLFVMEGDSVTLHTDISKTQQERIKWYFNDLDHQTGSLTITNIRTTDSGLYKLQIINNSSSINVPAAEIDEVKTKSVMEGESVTLDTHVLKQSNDFIAWYFNDILITEINGHLRYVCTEEQCNKGTERFRHRLRLDHQTGSLTIMNTRITDSGDYHLEIFSSNFSISNIRSFSVTVTGDVCDGGRFSHSTHWC